MGRKQSKPNQTTVTAKHRNKVEKIYRASTQLGIKLQLIVQKQTWINEYVFHIIAWYHFSEINC